MNGSHKTVWVLVAIALVSAGWFRLQTMEGGPTKPQQVPTIVFLTGGSGPYWQLTSLGAEAAAAELGVELDIKMPSGDEDIGEQTQMLVKLKPDNLGGVAVSPLNAEGQTRLINRLAERTNVVTFDSDAELSNRKCYVGTNNYSAGRLCANLVAEALPSGGEVAVLMTHLTKSNLIDRKIGFEERLQSGGAEKEGETPSGKYTIVDYLVDDGSKAKCFHMTRKVMDSHPDLKCIVGMNAQHGPILLNVLKEAGKLGQITLVTFDEEEATLQGIEDGHIYATVAQDPYMFGYEAIRMLTRLYGGDEMAMPIVGQSSVHVSATPVKKENLQEFRKLLKERLGGKPAAISEKAAG